MKIFENLKELSLKKKFFLFGISVFSLVFILIAFNSANFFIKSKASLGVTNVNDFSISGNKIISPSGQTFIVKGVSSHYSVFMPHNEQSYSDAQYQRTDKDFDKMKSLGINTVRIFVSSSMYNEAAYVNESTSQVYRDKLQTVVSKARARGLIVLLTNAYDTHANALSFLQYLATTYKGDPYIWFTPMNEWRCADRPDNSLGYASPNNCENWTLWQSEHNAYIQTLRSNGVTSPILVNTPAYSWDLTRLGTYPLTDGLNRIIYGAHRYGNNNTSLDDNKTDSGLSGRAESTTMWARFADVYPIVADEIGGDNGGPGNYIKWNQDMMDYLREWTLNGLSTSAISGTNISYPLSKGSGVIGYTWMWSDLNTMVKNYDEYSYNITPFLNDNLALKPWGSYFINNYVTQVNTIRPPDSTTIIERLKLVPNYMKLN